MIVGGRAEIFPANSGLRGCSGSGTNGAVNPLVWSDQSGAREPFRRGQLGSALSATPQAVTEEFKPFKSFQPFKTFTQPVSSRAHGLRSCHPR